MGWTFMSLANQFLGDLHETHFTTQNSLCSKQKVWKHKVRVFIPQFLSQNGVIPSYQGLVIA